MSATDWLAASLTANRMLPVICSFLLCVVTGCAGAGEREPAIHAEAISRADLLAGYPEFAAHYASYEPTEQQLEQIQVLAGKEVLTLLGTWCHDSAREVPRLLKLLDVAEVKLKDLTLVEVDRDRSAREHLVEKYQLKYTPTFIVKDKGREVARIIETPTVDIASDFAAQINR